MVSKQHRISIDVHLAEAGDYAPLSLNAGAEAAVSQFHGRKTKGPLESGRLREEHRWLVL